MPTKHVFCPSSNAYYKALLIYIVRVLSVNLILSNLTL
jgi:hypothetical protein